MKHLFHIGRLNADINPMHIVSRIATESGYTLTFVNGRSYDITPTENADLESFMEKPKEGHEDFKRHKEEMMNKIIDAIKNALGD